MAAVFLHTFPANALRPAYEALAARHGHRVYPVVSYEGRNCYVTGSQRIRQNRPGRGFYNSVSVHFVDDDSTRQIPAGQFAKGAREALAPNTQSVESV